MREFIFWPETVDWQEFGRVFLIMSAIGLFVSCIVNYYLRMFSILAAQLSILFTLAIYPLVNFYALLAVAKDYLELTEKVDPANFGPLVFFSPLPVCIAIAAIPTILAARKTQTKSSSSILDKSKPLATILGGVISLLSGTVWLSINMLLNKETFSVTVLKTGAYTLLGFIMYLFSVVVITAIRKIFEKTDESSEFKLDF